MKKPFTILSSLGLLACVAYAYMPPQDILHNPKSIDWHLQHQAYFAKIQVARGDVKNSRSSLKEKKWV